MVLPSRWKSRHKSTCWWLRPELGALLWLCVTQMGCGSEAAFGTNVVQKDAEFDVMYNDTVTSENQTIYAFNHTVSRNKVSPPQHIQVSLFKLQDLTKLLGEKCFHDIFCRCTHIFSSEIGS